MTRIAQLVGVTVAPPLAISANADWRGSVALKAGVDLTGIAFRMQVRSADGALLADLSTENGLLAADDDGNLSWVLPAAKTKFLAPYSGGVPDLQAEADGEVLNLCAAPLAVTIATGVTTP